MVEMSYRFSSPRGDIVADEAMLGQRLVIGPSEYHGFLTLGNLFDSMGRFLLPENGACLPDILGQMWQHPVNEDEIRGITIRYEKYGTLYQVFSIDVSAGETSARLCANVAFPGPSEQTLESEYDLLTLLGKRVGFGLLPRVYKKGRIAAERAGGAETLFVVLLEWFEGYEEWHFHGHEGTTTALLWDMGKGYRFLSVSQTFDMVSQASRILTLCYDIESTRRITPWHHGGGDFIVRELETGIDLKLITTRGYEPIDSSGDEDALTALCAFCIETITKMRLDRLEGMGEGTWADRFVVEAALQGFFEALRIKEHQGNMGGISPFDVLQGLRSLDAERLRALVKRPFDNGKGSDFSDYLVVLRHLDDHVSEVRAAIRNL